MSEQQEQQKKAAVTAIIGRPSCGKSTFLNTACAQKVSIVSPVPQTTRNAVRGIVNADRGQIVFIDTPGYHNSEKKINLKLSAVAANTLSEADLVLYLIDATRESGEEEIRAAQLIKPHLAKTVIGFNKTDMPDANPQACRLFVQVQFPDFSPDRVFDISAKKKINIAPLLDCLFDLAPEAEAMYPQEYYTDQQVDFRIAEIIREKAINLLRNEIPHALYVEIADIEKRKNGKELWIRAFLVVERDSQKGIVIGRGAAMIRQIKTEAIRDCIKIFDYKINLDLQVKVHKNWRQKDPLLSSLIDR